MSGILIIGGGIAGVSAAARLAPHGPVTLLEGESQLGYHASGRSAAMFLSEYGNATVRALNHASADYLHHAHGGVLSQRGVMLLGKRGEEEDFAREAADFGMEAITVDEARGKVPILNPDVVTRAGFRGDVHDLDTDRFLQNFRTEARAAGAVFVTGAKVEAITRDGGTWRVTAGGRDYEAATLVNAAGAWADEVAKMAGVAPLGLQPFRRSMAIIPAPGGHDVSGWPFMDGLHESWYAKPDAGKLIVSPADEDPMAPMDAWADDMVLAEGLARYEEVVTEPVTRVEHNWAGLRTFAPDRTLVIGRDVEVPEFVWLAGQGGYGFQTAAAASRLCADLITAAPPELAASVVSALSPARFA
ncbi:FAD-dependent oxidoreductase [Aquicoccus sp. SCR17]|nr:FAD-dependent oxidoreductase [Carideicomes alvinocaridis]